MEEIRIQKLLSRNGSFSRRRVEELISQKRIKVNGKVESIEIERNFD